MRVRSLGALLLTAGLAASLSGTPSARAIVTGADAGAAPSALGVLAFGPGNVMEWCQDWYARDYYRVSPRRNPAGPETGAYRVLRGGTFFMDPLDLRTYARHAGWPSVQTHRMVGFRPVRIP